MQERRRGPDILIKLITFFSIFCGSLMIAVLLLVDRAKPRVETFFDRLLDVQLRSGWDQNLLRINLYILGVLSLCSIVGLILNSKRARRQTDHYRKSLFFSLIFCLGSLLCYLFIFPQS